MSWRRIFSVDWMFLAVWIVGFAIYQMQPLSDPDTPWHVATGLYILTHHFVPTTDPFSWTMNGHPWVTQEWLFEVVLAWLTQHLGFAGAWLLIVGVHTFTVVILYRLAIRVTDGNRIIAAVVASLGTLVALEFWTMRPQMVSYLMFAIFLWLLQRVREGRFLWLLAVPVLMVLWTNSHGSAAIGILMLLLEVALSFIPTIGRFEKLQLPDGARWRLLMAAVAGGAAGLLNPNGVKAYTYALLSGNSVMTNNIMEWHSPDFHNQFFQYGVLPFLIVTFLILLAQWKSLPIRELLYFGGTFAMTLIHQRFLPYLTIAAVPLLAYALSDWLWSLLSPSRIMRLINGGVILAAFAYLGWQLPQVEGSLDAHWSQGSYPVAAVNYMEQHHLTQGVLNAYHWGGYLIYRGIPTFVDGRTDIFLNGNVFTDYLALKNVWGNAADVLSSYNFKVALFPGGYPIVSFLTTDPSWHVVYSDANAEVLVHDTKSQ